MLSPNKLSQAEQELHEKTGYRLGRLEKLLDFYRKQWSGFLRRDYPDIMKHAMTTSTIMVVDR
jgi:hypothetical protein